MNIIHFPIPQILPLEDRHLYKASQFLNECWHNEYALTVPYEITIKRDNDYFNNYLKNKLQLVWIAILQDKIIGIISITSNCIDELWVETSYRRRKIGQQLLKEALNYFYSRGFNSAQVGIESININAQKFYKSLDWIFIGSQPIQTKPVAIDALVYTKKITSNDSFI